MEREANQICPWCQTEIVWDPEIGAEDECPHCLNQLGGYRSLTFTMKNKDDKAAGGASSAAGRTSIDNDVDDWDDEEEAFDGDESGDEGPGFDDAIRSGRSPLFADGGFDDVYGEKVEQCIDTQEEAPECISCRELMLLAGHRELGADFKPHTPAILDKPFLTVPVRLDLYVCPNCFRTETMLSEEDRIHMIKAIKEG